MGWGQLGREHWDRQRSGQEQNTLRRDGRRWEQKPATERVGESRTGTKGHMAHPPTVPCRSCPHHLFFPSQLLPRGPPCKIRDVDIHVCFLVRGVVGIHNYSSTRTATSLTHQHLPWMGTVSKTKSSRRRDHGAATITPGKAKRVPRRSRQRVVDCLIGKWVS